MLSKYSLARYYVFTVPEKNSPTNQENNNDNNNRLQMLSMAQHVVSKLEQQKDHDNNDDDDHVSYRHLNDRERCHIRALRYMLQYQHKAALYTYLDLLRKCPGDVLALSLLLDLANTLGDSQTALKAAASTAPYWNERRGGWIRPAIPGYAIACAYQSLGLAVGGRHVEAEELCQRTMGAKNVCGAVSTWALAHILDAQGRTAEGISFLANHDGLRNYQGAGFLFFESRLLSYGCRYLLDREERGRGQSAALRIYDGHIERVLQYSGFAQNKPHSQPPLKAPLGWSETTTTNTTTTSNNNTKTLRSAKDSTSSSTSSSSSSNSIFSLFSNRFSFQGKQDDNDPTTITTTTTTTTSHSNHSSNEEEAEIIVANHNKDVSRRLAKKDHVTYACEDIFTWLPPTPQLLSDATLLLWRLTLNGTITAQDIRWDHVRNAWKTLFQLEQKQQQQQQQQFSSFIHNNNNNNNKNSISFKHAPLICMSASLLIPPSLSGGDQIGTGRLASALYRMGELMGLGGGGVGRTNNNNNNNNNRPQREHEEESLSSEDGNGNNNNNNNNIILNNISNLLKRVVVAETNPNFWYPEYKNQKEWKTVVDDILSAMDGFDYDYEYDDDDDDDEQRTMRIIFGEEDHHLVGFSDMCWSFDGRPFLDHTLVYAACKAGDPTSLCRARSVCSQGVTLRPNSPEEWWRYSIVLGLLGDQVASEQALVASVNLGAGQGAKPTG